MRILITILLLFYPTLVIPQQSTQIGQPIEMPESSFQKGQKVFTPVDIPDDAKEYVVTYTRDQIASKASDKDIVNILADVSWDGGQTWELGWGGMSAFGGTWINKLGNINNIHSFSGPLKPFRNRQLRIRVSAQDNLNTVIQVKFL